MKSLIFKPEVVITEMWTEL